MSKRDYQKSCNVWIDIDLLEEIKKTDENITTFVNRVCRNEIEKNNSIESKKIKAEELKKESEMLLKSVEQEKKENEKRLKEIYGSISIPAREYLRKVKTLLEEKPENLIYTRNAYNNQFNQDLTLEEFKKLLQQNEQQ